MESHTILPKSSLLRFSNSGIFNYLDLSTMQIKSAYAKTYNTETDYYPKEIEDYLSSEVETVMGKLYKSLDGFTSNRNAFVYDDDIKTDVIRCIAIQWLRVPKAYESIKRNSIFGPTLHLPELYYSPLHKKGTDLLQVACNTYENLLADYELNICIIRKDLCSSSFILPTSHCLGIGTHIFFILSPYHSFVLLPKADNAVNQITNGTQRYFSFKSDDEIEPIYERFIKAELEYDNKILIGLREQLEKIQTKYLYTDLDSL